MTGNSITLVVILTLPILLASAAFGGPCVYVSTRDAVDDSKGYVQPVNAETKQLGDTIPVGAYPNSLALSPDGRELYVVSSKGSSLERGEVSVVDTITREVERTISVGRVPVSVSLSPDGTTAFVLNACGFDSTCSGLSAISVIDTTTKEPIGHIFSKGNTTSYNTNCSTSGLAVSRDNRYLYAACMGSKLLVISLEEYFAEPSCPQCAIIREVQIRADSTLFPSSVSFSPDGTLAFVGARSGNEAAVAVVDVATHEVTKTVSLPDDSYGFSGVVAIALNDGRGYVSHRELGGAAPINSSAGTLGDIVVFPNGDGAKSLGFDPLHNWLIAVAPGRDGIFFIDVATNSPIHVPCIPGRYCAAGFLQLDAGPRGIIVATEPSCPPQLPKSTTTPTMIASPTAPATATGTQSLSTTPTATVQSVPTFTNTITRTPTITPTPTTTFTASPTRPLSLEMEALNVIAGERTFAGFWLDPGDTALESATIKGIAIPGSVDVGIDNCRVSEEMVAFGIRDQGRREVVPHEPYWSASREFSNSPPLPAGRLFVCELIVRRDISPGERIVHCESSGVTIQRRLVSIPCQGRVDVHAQVSTPTPRVTPTKTATRTRSAINTFTPSPPATPCQGDENGDRLVTVSELVRAVNNLLNGCPQVSMGNQFLRLEHSSQASPVPGNGR